MMIAKPIPEMVGEVVARVKTAMLPYLQSVNPTIQTVHYEHGHPREIVATLLEMNNPQAYQFLKYPLIALFQDFAEDIGRTNGVYGTVKLQMVIANQGEQTDKAANRYARNFKPILYPLYEELLKQIAASPYFQCTSAGAIRHIKTDRPFWGREGLYGNDANITTDVLDCIEIRGMELTVRRAACVAAGLSSINSNVLNHHS